MLEHNSNNFLAGIHFTEDHAGIAFLDISTGEFFVAEGNSEYIDKLLQTLKPAEVIFQRSFQKHFKEVFRVPLLYLHNGKLDLRRAVCSQKSLLKHFNTHSLKGFGVEELHLDIVAAGAVLHYLKDTEHPNLQHITCYPAHRPR